MRRCTRAVIGGLIAVLLLPLFASSPARASHANVLGHWNQPPLVVSSSAPLYDALIQDAAYYWQDVAFFRGYYPPLPTHAEVVNCNDPFVGRIVVCMVHSDDPRLGHGKRGNTRTWLYPDGSGHIMAKTIHVSNALAGADLQNTMRHEWGHALGLGHYSPEGGHAGCSVMNDPACGPYSNGIDQYGVYSWQPFIRLWQSAWHNQH